jgi:hypothetical protein
MTATLVRAQTNLRPVRGTLTTPTHGGVGGARFSPAVALTARPRRLHRRAYAPSSLADA